MRDGARIALDTGDRPGAWVRRLGADDRARCDHACSAQTRSEFTERLGPAAVAWSVVAAREITAEVLGELPGSRPGSGSSGPWPRGSRAPSCASSPVFTAVPWWTRRRRRRCRRPHGNGSTSEFRCTRSGWRCGTLTGAWSTGCSRPARIWCRFPRRRSSSSACSGWHSSASTPSSRDSAKLTRLKATAGMPRPRPCGRARQRRTIGRYRPGPRLGCAEAPLRGAASPPCRHRAVAARFPRPGGGRTAGHRAGLAGGQRGGADPAHAPGQSLLYAWGNRRGHFPSGAAAGRRRGPRRGRRRRARRCRLPRYSSRSR